MSVLNTEIKKIKRASRPEKLIGKLRHYTATLIALHWF